MRRTIGRLLVLGAVLAAPSAAAQEVEAAPEDYAVYRAALEALYQGRELASGLPDGPLVVVRSTYAPEARSTFALEIPREMVGIDSTTVAAVRAMEGRPGRITPDSLRLWLPVVAITLAGRDTLLQPTSGGPGSWARFEARYGEGATLVTLSRVVYGRGHTQAVVAAFRSCGPRCGQGGTLLMQKQDGRWTLQRAISRSFS